MKIETRMISDYVNHMGSDLLVVNAARVSFDKESHELTPRDTKLIGYLADHDHWTPFGHPTITIRETIPVFVARQRMRSNIGFVYNEVSRRYVSDEPMYWMPDEIREAPTNAKQGSGSGNIKESTFFKGHMRTVIRIANDTYNQLIAAGAAPEVARSVLPQSMYTSYYVTGSLMAWARAYNLRADKHAQLEIQHLAETWARIIRPLFPVSWEALTK